MLLSNSPEFTVLFTCSFTFCWNYNSGSGSGSMRIWIHNTGCVYSDDWDLGCCGAEPDVSIEECEPSQDVEGLHHYLLIVPPLVLLLTIIKTVYEFCDKCCGAWAFGSIVNKLLLINYENPNCHRASKHFDCYPKSAQKIQRFLSLR